MAKSPKTDVEQFLKNLHDAPPSSSVFVGMVKPCEGDRDSLMFAHVGDCSHWTKIHKSAIDKAESLRTVSCQGHEHLVARLTLNAPVSETEQAFAGLAALHKAQLHKTRQAMARSPAGPEFTQAFTATGQCPEGYIEMIDRFGQSHCVKSSEL